MTSRRQRDAHVHRGIRRLIGLLAITGLLISTLTTSITFAGQADPIQPDQMETAEAQEQPDIGTAESLQPDPDLEQQAPDLQPTGTASAASSPFFLQLIKRVCPFKEGMDYPAYDYATLDDACRIDVANPTEFFFIVTDANGVVKAINRTDVFLELPAGTTLVEEKHAGDYGDPIVFCSFGKGAEPVPMPVTNRQVSLNPKPDILITCEFFNPELPAAPTAGSTLTVHKRICEPGYDFSAPRANPMVDCTGTIEKVPFELSSNDPTFPNQQQDTGAIISSAVVFEQLPAGTYTLTETPPDGVSGAFVWYCADANSLMPRPSEPLSQGFTLSLDIAEGSNLVCYWFNLRNDENGSITVLKWLCPVGYDLKSRKANPVVDCTKTLDDVGFALYPDDRNVDAQKGRTGDVDPGMVTFDNLPAGSYTIEELLPDGVAGSFIWYCTDNPRQRQSPGGALATGTRLTVDLEPGQDLWCLWYNVQEDGPTPTGTSLPTPTEPPLPTEETIGTTAPGGNSLTIYKWACPEGSTPTSQLAIWYTQTCTEPLDGIVFTVTTDTDAITMSTSGGVVTWDDLPEGPFGLTEDIPAGFGPPVVFCSVTDDANPVEVSAPKGMIESAFDGDAQHVTCHWYNMPLADAGSTELPEPTPEKTDGATTQGNDLAIAVFACPGNPVAPLEFTALLAACSPYEGMGFGLLAADGPTSYLSDAEGQAQWVAIPAGSWQLEQITPHEYGEPQVFCGPAGTSSPASIPVSENVIQGEFSGSGEQLACWWFNHPNFEPGGSGRISVYMYTCPAGSTYETVSDTWFDTGNSACSPEAGVEVTLSYAGTGGGQVIRPQTTNDNGRARWDDGVPAAPWQIASPPDTGFGNPLVICSYVNPPEDIEAGWRTHTDVQGGRYDDIFLADDMQAECHWFNIPTVDPGGFNRIDLYVSDCPAGTTAESIIQAWPFSGASGCVGMEGVEVTLAYADASGTGEIHRPLTTNGNGRAFWNDGVPTAPWSLTLPPADGDLDPLVICSFWSPSQGVDAGWRIEEAVPGGRYEDTFEQDDLLAVCHWFTIAGPGEDAGTGIVLPQPTEPPQVVTPAPGGNGDAKQKGSITILKRTCPAGFDIDLDNADPADSCTKSADGISFMLLAAGDAPSAGQRARTGDDTRSAVVFDNLPPGTYLIQEANSPDIADAFVWYCTGNLRTQQSPASPLARGTTLELDLGPGESLYCLWFNVPPQKNEPADTPADSPAVGDTPPSIVPIQPVLPGDLRIDLPVAGEIRLSAFACGDDTQVLLPGSGGGYYRTECTQPLVVEFKVGERRESTTWYTSRITDSEGTATFDRLELVSVIIEQDNVRGYTNAQVFCRKSGSSTGDWFNLPVEQSAPYGLYSFIEATLDDESPTLECEWFNMPLKSLDWERRGYVSRYICLDPDMSQPLPGQCEPDADRPTTFQTRYATWEIEPQTLEWVHFHARIAPIWPFSLRETLPDGFSPPIANCRIVDYNSTYQTIEDIGWLEASADGEIAFDPIGIDNALRCDWYSIVQSEGRSLTLFTHACPTRTFIAHENCTIDPTVRRYDLEIHKGGTWQQHSTVTVGRNGKFVWEDLQPGTYRLVQDGGSWCHLTTDHPSAFSLFEVVSGEDTIVRVYNCAGSSAPSRGTTGTHIAGYAVMSRLWPPGSLRQAVRRGA